MKKQLPLIFFLCALLFAAGMMLYAHGARSPEEAFRAAISQYKENHDIPEAVYARFYDSLGPDKMLSIIDERPACHVEGHNLGRLMYEHTQDLPATVYECDTSCWGGCVHGAMLGFVQHERAKTGVTGDPRPEDLTPALMSEIKGLCDNSVITRYTGPGNCYHALGHLFAYFTDSDIEETQKLCRTLSDKGEGAVFNCVTGAYMQRVTDYGDTDKLAEPSGLYPCDARDYPAACYVYRLEATYASTTAPAVLNEKCNALAGIDRQGCFFGLGRFYAQRTLKDPAMADQVCATNDATARRLCFNGLLGQLTARGFRNGGETVCPAVKTISASQCLESTKSVFSMGLDFSKLLVRR